MREIIGTWMVIVGVVILVSMAGQTSLQAIAAVGGTGLALLYFGGELIHLFRE